VPLSAV